MLCHVTLCHIVVYYVILRYFTLCCFVLYCAMLLCCVVGHGIIERPTDGKDSILNPTLYFIEFLLFLLCISSVPFLFFLHLFAIVTLFLPHLSPRSFSLPFFSSLHLSSLSFFSSFLFVFSLFFLFL